MAPTFRYRYVDVGTVFTGDSRRRDVQSGQDSPSTLYRNELACDVGGTCWDANQPLAILDPRGAARKQFPSASAAVLHKAAQIRDKFTAEDVVWLVTNNQPEFDALSSLYLARYLIADPQAVAATLSYKLDSECCPDTTERRSFNWLEPDVSGFPAHYRWPLLLASYASRLEMRLAIPCPRARDLRSVLYAALKRGRDYLSETGGATDFFDEVRRCVEERQLNPAFDSVLEGSLQFAPELAMLDRESEAYERDLKHARKALVFLPEAEAPTPDFFEHPKKRAGTRELGGHGLRLADSFRIASDGIYLRNPECALFKEWARLDIENSVLGRGFEFAAIARSHQPTHAASNASQYEFSIDPQTANGRHLYTVWSRLQADEVEALRAKREQASIAAGALPAQNHAEAAHSVQTLISDAWIGGHNSSTTVESPRRGTLMGPPGVRSDLRDDPVAEAVRTELEAPIYAPTSPGAGPQIAIHDLAASPDWSDEQTRHSDLNAPLKIPPPEPTHYRFAGIALRSDVPLAESGAVGVRLAEQIAETLWRALHPETAGAIPQDLESRLIVAAEVVGVWSDRGIAVAQKAHAMQTAEVGNRELLDFTALVALMRDIGAFAAECKVQPVSGTPPRDSDRSRKPGGREVELLAAEGEELARRALELQHTLALPGRQLLRCFSQAIDLESIISRLRDLNQAFAEQSRRDEAEADRHRREKRDMEMARQRQNFRWAELLVIGFVALEAIGIVVRNVNLGPGGQEVLLWLGGPLVLLCAAWLLEPWRLKPSSGAKPKQLGWILVPALLVWVAEWILQAFGSR